MWDSDVSPEILLRHLIREELIGMKGGVRYYQMGASLPDHLYNLDDEGRPTRDPGVPGLNATHKKKRRRVHNT